MSINSVKLILIIDKIFTLIKPYFNFPALHNLTKYARKILKEVIMNFKKI